MIKATHIYLIVAVLNKKIVGSGYVRIENSKHYHKNPKHGLCWFYVCKARF